MEHGVGIEHAAGRDRRLFGQPRVDRGEVRAGGVHQLFVAVDDEIGLLVAVDAVAGAHDPLQVETDAVRRRAFQAVDAFALGADDAGAVDAQAVGFADQAELDRVPVQPGEVGQRLRTQRMRLHAAAAVGGHVVGEHRVHQQRHVPEQVVEQVGFGQIVELLGLADPPGHREATVGEMLEEHQLRQQPFDADDLPAGGGAQHAVEIVEFRDPVRRHAHVALAAQELGAGAADQQLLLALEQRRPDLVIGAGVGTPRLLDHAGGVQRHVALVGHLVFDALRGGSHGVPLRGRQDIHCRRLSAQRACLIAGIGAGSAIKLRHSPDRSNP